MNFIPSPAPTKNMPQWSKFLSLHELGTIQDAKGTALCSVCLIVEEKEVGSPDTIVCIPPHSDFVLSPHYNSVLMTGEEGALFDTSEYGRVLRNLANRIATRFDFTTRTIKDIGEQQRNARVLYNRDVISIVAALSDEAAHHTTGVSP